MNITKDMERFDLQIGQRFHIPSAIAQGYEVEFGEFSFIAEVVKLGEHRTFGASQPVTRDLFLRAVDRGNEPYGGPRWYVCYCLAHGHDKYGDPALNWSPDLINGGTWYVPALVQWQHLFCYLWRHDIVELIPQE